MQEQELQRIESVIDEVARELVRATEKFGTFRSSHEGYGVIAEEVDELFDEIKANNPEKARKEAIQVAAMGARYVLDLG